jgi:hypothetical protein
MTALLEKALEKVGALPQEDQDAIASEILDSLADEEAWKVALPRDATASGNSRRKPWMRTTAARLAPWQICFDRVEDYSTVWGSFCGITYRTFQRNPNHPSLHSRN